MSSTDKAVDIIDKDGTVLGVEEVQATHDKHLLHRAVHILVINDENKVFARQRPKTKLVYPGLWTSSVGAHVLSGMTPDATAATGLKDFLGLELPLHKLGEAHVTDSFEDEIITIYTCRANAIPSLNPDESNDGRFMSLEEINYYSYMKEATPHLLSSVKLLSESLQ